MRERARQAGPGTCGVSRLPLADGSGRDRQLLVADGSGRDRQVLVAGRGPAALATAGFLDQAGLDPVVADRPGGRPEPAAVTLWRPGLELLERLGLRRPVEAAGTPLTALRCIEPSKSWTGDASDRPSLVAVRRDDIETLLSRRLRDRVRTTERSVTSLSPCEGGVRVTFEGGITEPFDAVVTTDPALLPEGSDREESASVHWWSFDWPAAVPAPDVPTEAWGRGCAAFAVPVGEAVRVVLVATEASTPASPLSLDRLAGQFCDLSGGFGDAIRALDRPELQYGRASRAVPGRLCVDGVALVGRPVHAAMPGGCLGSALAVEDGWVLADALTYGPAPVGAALGEYADRRRERLTALGSTLSEAALVERVSEDLSGPLRRLCARRTLAFGHLLDTHTAFARGIPERL